MIGTNVVEYIQKVHIQHPLYIQFALFVEQSKVVVTLYLCNTTNVVGYLRIIIAVTEKAE